MGHRYRALFVIVLLVALLVVGVVVTGRAAPGQGYTLVRQGIAIGGAAMSSDHFQMVASAGQASPVGSASSPNFWLGSGMWGGGRPLVYRYHIWLPLVVRE